MIKLSIMKPVLVLLSILSLVGCAHWMDDMGLRDETVYPPVYPTDIPPPPKTNGTIYQPGYEVSLYKDHIASRVGDLITVRLEETTTGQKEAHTKTDKISVFNSNNGPTTNNPSTLHGNPLKPVMVGGTASDFIFSLGTNNTFDGKGATNQSNKLLGTITVTVVRVLSNNNMIIQGESWVTINQGREYVRLTGIIRPEDVETNNVISSQRIANARIAYSGSGQVGNASRGGFLTQFLTKFFPY